MNKQISISKFVFKVDGVLTTCARGETQKDAESTIKRMWPRSTVQFLREEFSHMIGDYERPSHKPAPKRSVSNLSIASKPRPMVEKSIEEHLEEKLGEMFSGA
ncbi:MAG: hypothetical protein IBX56_20050 [Methylomicrobium sp.]|nr:hypothetical protein [Methylomicrobium sp.]